MTGIVAIALLAEFASHMTAYAAGRFSYYSSDSDQSLGYPKPLNEKPTN